MKPVDRRKFNGRNAARQMTLPGLELPRSDGYAAALQVKGEPPKPRSGTRVFEVVMGTQVFKFQWNPQCKVCHCLRDPLLNRPKYSTSTLVYESVNNLYVGLRPCSQILAAVTPMMEGWEPADVLTDDNVQRHTARHVPIEIQARNEVVHHAVRTFGGTLEGLSGIGLAFAISKVLLRGALEDAAKGELRVRSVGEVPHIAAVAATVERDYLGTGDLDEMALFAHYMDLAVVGFDPPESLVQSLPEGVAVDQVLKDIREAIYQKFQQLDRQAERSLGMVRRQAVDLEARVKDKEEPVPEVRLLNSGDRGIKEKTVQETDGSVQEAAGEAEGERPAPPPPSPVPAEVVEVVEGEVEDPADLEPLPWDLPERDMTPGRGDDEYEPWL